SEIEWKLLFRIEAEPFDRLLDGLRGEGAALIKRVKRRDRGGLGVDFEKPSEIGARVAAAEAAGAEAEQAAGHPRGDLIRHHLQVVGNRDERTFLVLEDRLDVGLLRRRRRLEHVPAPRAQRLAAEQLVAGRAPDIGRDVELRRQYFLGAQRLAQQGTAAEDVRLEFFSFARGAELVEPLENALLGALWHLRHRIIFVVKRQIVKILLAVGV